jgi:hypothetical protein
LTRLGRGLGPRSFYPSGAGLGASLIGLGEGAHHGHVGLASATPRFRDAANPEKDFQFAVGGSWPLRLLGLPGEKGKAKKKRFPQPNSGGTRFVLKISEAVSERTRRWSLEDGNKLADKPAILEFLATWSKRHPAKKRQRSEECDCDSWFEYDAMLRSRSCEGSAGRWSACTTCAILEIQPFDDQVERDVAVRLASTYNARLS